MFFYGRGDPRYLSLPILAITFSYQDGRGLSLSDRATSVRRALVVFGVSCNPTLRTFKHTDFLLARVNALVGPRLPPPDVILPPGISFCTYMQIAFLVDAYGFKTRERSRTRYDLSVSYFPHLIGSNRASQRGVRSWLTHKQVAALQYLPYLSQSCRQASFSGQFTGKAEDVVDVLRFATLNTSVCCSGMILGKGVIIVIHHAAGDETEGRG
jgi:hypothetical protein